MMRAHFNWKLIVFVVLLLPVLLRLGFWQLDRAEEKRTILAAQKAQAEQPAEDLKTLPIEAYQNYRNVTVTARLMPEIYLLDNQVHQGKTGYEVIQVADMGEGRRLLVSRGWIKAADRRDVLPEIDTPSGIQLFSGYLYQPQEMFKLDETPLTSQWPQVIQSVELEKLYKQVSITDRMPPLFLLRLDQYNPAVLTGHWQIINVQPEKHTGYAVQWFSMAAVVIVLTVIASIRRTPVKEKA